MNKIAVLKSVGLCGLGLLIGWFAHGMLGGGGAPPHGMMQMPPAVVRALVVKESALAPDEKYIAKVEAVQDVMIRAEVSGTIDQVHFSEGSNVRAGELLFTMDRSSYQAMADAAEAELFRTQKLYERLKRSDVRSVSEADMESAESAWLTAKAALDLAMVSLNKTQIKAPISGKIGQAMITKGNYVSPTTEGLARIVQIDPVRVVFSQTDRDHLAFQRRELGGDLSLREAHILLPDGSILPTVGKKEFDDNAINPFTGTVAVRYLFDNPNGLLVPGGYVSAQLSNPAGATGIKIPQRAVLIDPEGSFVLTVNGEGVVGMARVVAGNPVGGDVVISSGLNPGDRVVVEGVQKARPGATVQVSLLEE